MSGFSVKLDVQECAELYRNGWSAKQLGEKYGCSDETIRRRLAKAGFKIKPKGYPRRHCKFVCLGMHNVGMDSEEIASTLGVSTGLVGDWLRSFGLTLQSGIEIDVERCACLLSSGYSLTQIGSMYGCSYMTISRKLKEAGVYEPRKRGVPQKHCRHICLAMHEAGLTDAQIAETFGVNRATVNEWLRSFGVKRGKGFASNKDMAGVLAKSNASRSRNAEGRFLKTFADRLSSRFELLEHDKLNTDHGNCRLRCKTCGHEFDRCVDFKYETTCPVCREEELRREAEERKAMRAKAEELRKAANLQVDRTCRECGATFHSEYENAAYCSPECRRKHVNKATAARHKHNGHAGTHRKRARKYGCAYDPSVNLKRLIERDGLTCYICGKQCDPNDLSWGSSGPNRPTLDHVVPLAKGGGHVWGNVKVCCGECNSAKRDLDVAEVLATA